MFNWLIKLVPEKYKWDVAAKKIAYTLGKLAVAGLAYGKVGQVVGSHLTPDQMTEVQTMVAGVVAAGLTGLHDWLHMKYPDNPWL